MSNRTFNYFLLFSALFCCWMSFLCMCLPGQGKGDIVWVDAVRAVLVPVNMAVAAYAANEIYEDDLSYFRRMVRYVVEILEEKGVHVEITDNLPTGKGKQQ